MDTCGLANSELRNFILEMTFSYGYQKWNFHIRSFLNWHRYEKIVDEIFNLLPHGLVLDVGCGFGQITEMLHLKGIIVYGIDLGGQTRENKVWKHLSAPFILGDGCNLPFKSKMFDAVICCGVLEHVYNERKFLKECGRVLKNNNLFLCYYLPNKTGFESLFSKIIHTEHKFYDNNGINHLFRECGYEILNITREHFIPVLGFGRTIEYWNRFNKILSLLDDMLIKTPLKYFGDNWKIYARKMYKPKV